MTRKALYTELYEYSTLEAAYEAAFLYLENAPEDAEEWLTNLQNHLIWRSYNPGENPNMDVVVLSAIEIVLKRHSLRLEDAGAYIKNMVNELTLA